MPSNTTRLNLRIPLDADPFADGGTATRNLGNDLDDVIAAKQRRGRAAGAADASGDLTVTHGLGVAPTSVLVSNGQAAGNWVVSSHTYTATTFKVRFRVANTAAVVAAGTGVTLDWQASA